MEPWDTSTVVGDRVASFIRTKALNVILAATQTFTGRRVAIRESATLDPVSTAVARI